MADLADGEVVQVQGSASKPYELKNTGGVYSCSCPAWRNQSIAIERRTCKHLRKHRGSAAEDARLGSAPAQRIDRPEPEGDEEAAEGPPLLLAERWDNVQDLTGWWMSEKLDGVRAYWDGKNFISRLGNLYHAPDWFLEKLPPTPLDGELWTGRKLFQRTVSIVRRQDKNELWKEVRFLVFDAPALDAPFEERLDHCRKALDGRPPYAQVHDHQVCKGLDVLRAELARVESLGGEGLMLRMPASKYVQGRSSTLLKVKSFHDAEARVIGHVAGAGRHKGRLGALEVETAEGTRFSVGTGFSDAERGAPPPVGAVITFRYQELSTGGVPRFPSFVGIRTDVKLAPPKAKATAAPQASGKGARRYECIEGSSKKFWQVSVSGCDLTVVYGRIATEGQSKTKTFATEEEARREADKLIAEKTAKGYGPA
ncbi:MAG TPA: DNA ligase [Planctomycetota bacterium]|nr:DNA ligase [Planctomycetota bacterium]